MLKVKEIFGPTIQGEGELAGSPAIFVRFAGCNKWNGRAETKAASSCNFCDTDFTGGELLSVNEVYARILGKRPMHSKQTESGWHQIPYLVVITGGEPMLQPEREMLELINMLQRQANCHVQMETNGTVWKQKVALALDYITVSPKEPAEYLVCDWSLVTCLKLLHPYPRVPVDDFLEIAKRVPFACIQPIEPPPVVHTPGTVGAIFETPATTAYRHRQDWKANVSSTVALVKRLGRPFRLSLQTHKTLGEQ